MTIKRGDRVRICKTNSSDEGRVGIVYQLADWYGQPVATVQFDGATWDESDRDDFYLFQLERVAETSRSSRSHSQIS